MLERLSNAIGVSGGEHEVRKLLREAAAPYGEIHVDVMGNLYVHKQGDGPTIMACAHMDEVGMMIKGIMENGMLAYSAVGVDPRVAISKRVLVGKDKIPGVIGAKAIHLQRGEERTSMPSHDNLFIDIGAKDKQEAMRFVKIGDYAGFDTTFAYFGENLMRGKALDDRVGCAAVLELLQKEYDCNFYGVFTVQEEVGLRGAMIAANYVKPDVALIFEGTTANDMPGVEGHGHVTKVGNGPALSVMDMGTIVKPKMLNALVQAAEESGTPYQYRQGTRGGTDGGSIHKAGLGAIVGGISVPCRYIHSPVSVASVEDYKNVVRLADYFLANKRFEEVI